mmetsp:Transcript_53665/g.96623  ORF Transcript_53665/g.96623 Transcript_53665/m.96623 type:complete len:90 (+) Transcript_53665:129-398(+)
MAGVGDWKRLFLALAFLNCATYVSAQGETGELGSAPACWINWPVEIISEEGVKSSVDACKESSVVMLMNVIFFYVIFGFVVKTLVLSTS